MEEKRIAATGRAATKLLLVRHGQTVDNVGQIMQGQRPGRLTATGVAEIEALAERLAGVAVDAVVASDLKRAVDSAEIIARRRGLPVVTTPLLRERDWGDFTGRYIPDLRGVPMPENVEKMDALLARAGQFLSWVRANYAGQAVVAVGHGIINKAIQAVYFGKPMREIAKMANAECREFSL
ncbi:MAG: histidine phosphatase family protein [Prevotella sp.]|nr:histidine phosphatase family protein [Prevotella sp.]